MEMKTKQKNFLTGRNTSWQLFERGGANILRLSQWFLKYNGSVNNFVNCHLTNQQVVTEHFRQ